MAKQALHTLATKTNIVANAVTIMVAAALVLGSGEAEVRARLNSLDVKLAKSQAILEQLEKRIP
jgi:hypothetical protein